MGVCGTRFALPRECPPTLTLSRRWSAPLLVMGSKGQRHSSSGLEVSGSVAGDEAKEQGKEHCSDDGDEDGIDEAA